MFIRTLLVCAVGGLCAVTLTIGMGCNAMRAMGTAWQRTTSTVDGRYGAGSSQKMWKDVGLGTEHAAMTELSEVATGSYNSSDFETLQAFVDVMIKHYAPEKWSDDAKRASFAAHFLNNLHKHARFSDSYRESGKTVSLEVQSGGTKHYQATVSIK